MHNLLLAGIVSAVLALCTTLPQDTHPLVGKWEYSATHHGGPFKLMAVFRANGTFDAFVNKKEFVSGTYRLKNDTLYVSDPTCNAQYEGIYKVEFFGKNDSLLFHALQDTCVGRKTSTAEKLFKHITQKPE
ncbi:MAG: hypothetical protein DI539_23905 [Flavobacterium psychrophilum]|nr:MAG: hypothetical protein DI539_23905 [Flavobacterium psychrophilum]